MKDIFKLGEHNICGFSYSKIKSIKTKMIWLTFLFVHFQIILKKNKLDLIFGIGYGMPLKIRVGFSA